MKLFKKIRNCFRIKDGKRYKILLQLRNYTKKYFFFTFYYKDPLTQKIKTTHHHFRITRMMQLEKDNEKSEAEKRPAHILLANAEFINFMNNGFFDTDNKTAKTTHIKPLKGEFTSCTREFLNKQGAKNKKMYDDAIRRLKKNEQSN